MTQAHKETWRKEARIGLWWSRTILVMTVRYPNQETISDVECHRDRSAESIKVWGGILWHYRFERFCEQTDHRKKGQKIEQQPTDWRDEKGYHNKAHSRRVPARQKKLVVHRQTGKSDTYAYVHEYAHTHTHARAKNYTRLPIRLSRMFCYVNKMQDQMMMIVVTMMTSIEKYVIRSTKHHSK